MTSQFILNSHEEHTNEALPINVNHVHGCPGQGSDHFCNALFDYLINLLSLEYIYMIYVI